MWKYWEIYEYLESKKFKILTIFVNFGPFSTVEDKMSP